MERYSWLSLFFICVIANPYHMGKVERRKQKICLGWKQLKSCTVGNKLKYFAEF